jgi:hypothetical protein
MGILGTTHKMAQKQYGGRGFAIYGNGGRKNGWMGLVWLLVGDGNS